MKLLNTVVAGLFVGLFAFQAKAADSAWLLCDGESLVVNLLEHRTDVFDERATSFAMIVGMHVLQGEMINVESGAVALSGSTNGRANEFVGSISVDYRHDTVTVVGKLNLLGGVSDLDTQLTCKRMN